jgi:polyphosphate kinase
MPLVMQRLLQKTFGIQHMDMIPEGKYHNNFDFFKFPDFNKKFLKEPILQPLSYAPIEDAEDLFTNISKKDL